MKKTFRIALFALLLTVAGTAYAGATPRSTVQTFLICARSGDVKGVLRCLNGGHRVVGKADQQGILAVKLLFQGAYITRVEEVNWRHSIVYVKITNPSTGRTEIFPFSVKKINGDWKICDGN